MTNDLLPLTLHLADNALIIGHRLSEWCGHGPILEQDIALTNASLDHLGAARSLYQYAAEQFNALDEAAQDAAFTSPALDAARARRSSVTDKAGNGQPALPDGQAGGAGQWVSDSTIQRITEDDLAYLRDGWDFRNNLLCEQPNVDWAYTVIRGLLYDCFHFYYLRALAQSADQTLAAIAEKSLKETTYHLRWSAEWAIRLGDGTPESHAKAQAALNDYWAYTAELFEPTAYETVLQQAGIAPDLAEIKTAWEAHVARVLDEATLIIPQGRWLQSGGKEGRHSEHLGYVLAELQFMQRAYPGMEW